MTHAEMIAFVKTHIKTHTVLSPAQLLTNVKLYWKGLYIL